MTKWTAPKIDLDALSDDAKVLASTWFSNMRAREFYADIEPASLGGDPGLTFQFVSSVPTPRTQQALDELVNKGVVRCMPAHDNVQPGRVRQPIRYLPLVDCFPAFQWFGPMVVGPKADPERVEALSWVLMQTAPGAAADDPMPGTIVVEGPRRKR